MILVAHSMGNMVTFRYLWDHQSSAVQIKHFISLGSQLGLDSLMPYLSGRGLDRPYVPRQVEAWTNIYGQDDPIGFQLDQDDFLIHDPLMKVRNIQVDTGGLQTSHAIKNYLQTHEVARVIAKAWCEAFSSNKPAKCSVISEVSN